MLDTPDTRTAHHVRAKLVNVDDDFPLLVVLAGFGQRGEEVGKALEVADANTHFEVTDGVEASCRHASLTPISRPGFPQDSISIFIHLQTVVFDIPASWHLSPIFDPPAEYAWLGTGYIFAKVWFGTGYLVAKVYIYLVFPVIDCAGLIKHLLIGEERLHGLPVWQ